MTERDVYFREKATRDEIAIRIASEARWQANIRVIKTLVSMPPKHRRLEQAELDSQANTKEPDSDAGTALRLSSKWTVRSQTVAA
jgi:hypothetical protein